jgi:flavin-dependent dehydrogenase
VFGGGPAGATAAARLATLGWRVIVFERDRFPRFHIGESLLATVNEVLAALGLSDRVRAAGFPRKWGASFMTDDGACTRYADFSVSPEIVEPQTYQVPRETFDALLLGHAAECGARVLEEHRVLDARFGADGVTVEFAPSGQDRSAVRVRAVIDASGRTSLLARKLELRRPEPRLENVAIFAHYSNVPRPPGRRAGDIRIIARRDGGWFWIIPISAELTSVGVVVPRATFDRWPSASHEGHLRRAIHETPAAAALMGAARREWPVRVERDFSYCARRYAGARWLLAGDAGSFLDPVFSTGVSIALESGFEAAEALHRALASGDLSARAFDAFDRRQRRRYAAFRRFVVGFYRQSFRDLFFQPGGPRMFAAIVTVLAGRWRPRSFLRRRLIDGFFALVWVQGRVAIVPRLAGSRPAAAEHGTETFAEGP